MATTRYAAVTTFHQAGLEQYGQRMLDSFSRHWPENIPLLVYAEDCVPLSTDARTFAYDLHLANPDLVEFKERHADNPDAHGRGRKKGYRWDAVRFANKVYAVTHAGLGATHLLDDFDVLIWLDADLFFHSPVTHEFLGRLLPETSYLGWLARESMYPECGFVMYRVGHRAHRALFRAWRGAYNTDGIFHLPEWHDSYTLEWVVEHIRETNLLSETDVVSLSGSVGWKTSHPLIHSPIGAVADHLKGARKETGHSDASDLRVRREEPYWRDLTQC